MRQSFESFERVIDKHPVLVYYFSVLRHWCRCCDRWEGKERRKKKKEKKITFNLNLTKYSIVVVLKWNKRFVHLRISSFTSGNSSKLEVSSMERTSTGIAAGLSLICSQSTPRKKGASLSSSIPLCAPKGRLKRNKMILLLFNNKENALLFKI